MEEENDRCQKDTKTCCGACAQEKIDLKELGPEAEELARIFDDVSADLESALKKRKQIIEMVHEKSAESPEMKEKIDKVLRSRHPVLIQFVFGE